MTKEHLKLLIQIVKLKLQILILRKKLARPALSFPKFIIIHHEAGNHGFYSVNKWHLKTARDWHLRNRQGVSFNPEEYKSSLGYYCGYQLYLDKFRFWWRARTDFEEAAACPGHNKDGINICVMGHYGHETLDSKMKQVLWDKVDKLRAKYNIPRKNVLGDKEGRIPSRPTSCPESLMDFVKEYRTGIK